MLECFSCLNTSFWLRLFLSFPLSVCGVEVPHWLYTPSKTFRKALYLFFSLASSFILSATWSSTRSVCIEESV
ncbi:hypothetical protein Taro_039104 [Colocasia esculenta]|uniref:Uncharacterized protein n=1 Tax=Colocasia esculenta TaxID=4460 RepID=A0A843WQK6_COLES|nr:hypothetical protein [Colocasia esculenta]